MAKAWVIAFNLQTNRTNLQSTIEWALEILISLLDKKNYEVDGEAMVRPGGPLDPPLFTTSP